MTSHADNKSSFQTVSRQAAAANRKVKFWPTKGTRSEEEDFEVRRIVRDMLLGETNPTKMMKARRFYRQRALIV